MKKTVLLILILGMFVSCSKSKESAESDAPGETLSNVQNMDRFISGNTEEEQYRKTADEQQVKYDEGIKTPYYAVSAAAGSRMLEYRITLEYDSDNLLQSRENMLHLIEKYGFIKSGKTSTDLENPYFTTEVMIETKNIIQAIRDFSSLGILINDFIEVTDHTPESVMNTIQQERELQRVKRRETYAGNISVKNRNFSAIEQSLTVSEDSLDTARYNKWLIEDKITWTSVNITVTGPMPEKGITLPDYKKAFIELADFSLRLIYVVIILIPLWILIGILLIKREWFRKTFLSKMKK